MQVSYSPGDVLLEPRRETRHECSIQASTHHAHAKPRLSHLHLSRTEVTEIMTALTKQAGALFLELFLARWSGGVNEAPVIQGPNKGSGIASAFKIMTILAVRRPVRLFTTDESFWVGFLSCFFNCQQQQMHAFAWRL